MISVVVAEPIDVIDAGEMADFGGGQTAHGCRCSAARAHRLTSITSGLAIRKACIFAFLNLPSTIKVRVIGLLTVF